MVVTPSPPPLATSYSTQYPNYESITSSSSLSLTRTTTTNTTTTTTGSAGRAKTNPGSNLGTSSLSLPIEQQQHQHQQQLEEEKPTIATKKDTTTTTTAVSSSSSLDVFLSSTPPPFPSLLRSSSTAAAAIVATESEQTITFVPNTNATTTPPPPPTTTPTTTPEYDDDINDDNSNNNMNTTTGSTIITGYNDVVNLTIMQPSTQQQQQQQQYQTQQQHQQHSPIHLNSNNNPNHNNEYHHYRTSIIEHHHPNKQQQQQDHDRNSHNNDHQHRNNNDSRTKSLRPDIHWNILTDYIRKNDYIQEILYFISSHTWWPKRYEYETIHPDDDEDDEDDDATENDNDDNNNNNGNENHNHTVSHSVRDSNTTTTNDSIKAFKGSNKTVRIIQHQRTIKRRIFLILSDPNSSLVSVLYFLCMMILILAMNGIMIVQTMGSFQYTPVTCSYCNNTNESNDTDKFPPIIPKPPGDYVTYHSGTNVIVNSRNDTTTANLTNSSRNNDNTTSHTNNTRTLKVEQISSSSSSSSSVYSEEDRTTDLVSWWLNATSSLITSDNSLLSNDPQIRRDDTTFLFDAGTPSTTDRRSLSNSTTSNKRKILSLLNVITDNNGTEDINNNDNSTTYPPIPCQCPPEAMDWTVLGLGWTLNIFALDLILRVLLFSPDIRESVLILPWHHRIVYHFYYLFQYMTSISFIIDAFAIVPYYVAAFTRSNGLLTLRILQVLRVFQLVRIGQYNKTIQTFASVIQKSVVHLKILIAILWFGALIFGSLIYWLERGEWMYYAETNTYEFIRYSSDHQSSISPFTSIPQSFWWFIVTATTVGYGDMVPVSPLGQFIASGAMIMGLLVIAYPVSVFSELWSLELRKVGAIRENNNSTTRTGATSETKKETTNTDTINPDDVITTSTTHSDKKKHVSFMELYKRQTSNNHQYSQDTVHEDQFTYTDSVDNTFTVEPAPPPPATTTTTSESAIHDTASVLPDAGKDIHNGYGTTKQQLTVQKATDDDDDDATSPNNQHQDTILPDSITTSTTPKRTPTTRKSTRSSIVGLWKRKSHATSSSTSPNILHRQHQHDDYESNPDRQYHPDKIDVRGTSTTIPSGQEEENNNCNNTNNNNNTIDTGDKEFIIQLDENYIAIKKDDYVNIIVEIQLLNESHQRLQTLLKKYKIE